MRLKPKIHCRSQNGAFGHALGFYQLRTDTIYRSNVHKIVAELIKKAARVASGCADYEDSLSSSYTTLRLGQSLLNASPHSLAMDTFFAMSTAMHMMIEALNTPVTT